MDPIWDSAEDWCHYRVGSGRVEDFYILKQIFNYMKRGGRVAAIGYIPERLPIFSRY